MTIHDTLKIREEEKRRYLKLWPWDDKPYPTYEKRRWDNIQERKGKGK